MSSGRFELLDIEADRLRGNARTDVSVNLTIRRLNFKHYQLIQEVKIGEGQRATIKTDISRDVLEKMYDELGDALGMQVLDQTEATAD